MSVELDSQKRIEALIAAANSKTGGAAADLTAAVQDLCDGFGTENSKDTLAVVYCDEKFNDELCTHYIKVNQYLRTDLSQVPEAEGKYNNELYTYTGSVISDDGKTLYLHYQINLEALKPNYVVDFGLPLTFPLSAVTNEASAVTNVSVSATTQRGNNLTYDKTTETFTYTLNSVLRNTDVLTITLTFDGGSTGTSNVGVTPASNVLYEDTFLSVTDKIGAGYAEWTHENGLNPAQTADQTTLYGRDAAYDGKTGNSMNSAWTISGLTNSGDLTAQASQYLTTTFYGNGFDLIGTAGPTTGYVYLLVQGPENKLIIIDTSYVGDGTTLYQVPLAHLELTEGEYTVYVRAVYRAATAGTASANAARAVSTYSLYSAPSAADDIYAVLDELFMDGFEIDDVEFVYSDENSALAELAAPSMATFALNDGLDAQDAGDATAAAPRPAGTTVTIDGFRVYRSSDNPAYSASEQGVTYVNVLDLVEDGFVAFIESGADGSYTQTDYEASGGYQNEIYLATGQAVVFQTGLEENTKVQISARAVTGSTALVVNGDIDNAVTIISNTEMYYEVTVTENGVLTVGNTAGAEGMLALDNLKLPAAATEVLSVPTVQTIETAVQFLSDSAALEVV